METILKIFRGNAFKSAANEVVSNLKYSAALAALCTTADVVLTGGENVVAAAVVPALIHVATMAAYGYLKPSEPR